MFQQVHGIPILGSFHECDELSQVHNLVRSDLINDRQVSGGVGLRAGANHGEAEAMFCKIDDNEIML